MILYLVVRHQHVVDKHSCIGEGTAGENQGIVGRCFCYFMHFWVWPLGMMAAGVVLLILGYDVNDEVYDGCCGNGYNSCVP